MILSLDLLLTMTSFPDGQSWAMKQNELIEKLVELASSLHDKMDKPLSRFEGIPLDFLAAALPKLVRTAIAECFINIKLFHTMLSERRKISFNN